MFISNIGTVFLTGLLTGGLTCMAVQGGLVATVVAREPSRGNKTVAIFVISKLVFYSLFGFILGALGSVLQLSPVVSGYIQIGVAIFMIGTALNLLNIHPIFRYFVIQPPKFLTRIIYKNKKNTSLFAPVILGAFTIFIPCGTTQAMMALAIASGNPVSGALLMFAFILGTSPVFYLLGVFATKLSLMMEKRFTYVAAVCVMLLAVFNFNNGLALAGSNITLDSQFRRVWCVLNYECRDVEGAQTAPAQVVNEATITIASGGYYPASLTVKKGSQVSLHLKNSGGGGCIQAFTIPSLGIQKIVPIGSTETIRFTAPSQPGELTFMCSMGMYRGAIKVI